MFADIYNDRRVLVTGHTGFKGSWLSLWLTTLEAKVTGFSLPPTTHPNHWDALALDMNDVRGDIRDASSLEKVIFATQPEIVFHLAAQPLVRRSYRDPVETWSTNVMGTVNVLEACRQCESVQAVVVVTTDKCYENLEQIWGYREIDRLGGHDPYSASKAATEMAVSSYRKSFSAHRKLLIASARAGNVIGGGDWSEDRLIPDAVRALTSNQSLEIRSPKATRPWQHALESLSGYLALGQRLMQGDAEFADAWNFGPSQDGNRTVAYVLSTMRDYWPNLQWHCSADQHPHETTLLQLDSSKARQSLAWAPVWSIDECIKRTAEWYQAFLENQTTISHPQLAQYIADAKTLGYDWARDSATVPTC